MKLSVIIPVYNEEMTSGELIDRVKRVDIGNIEMEIIVANAPPSSYRVRIQ